MKTFKQIIQDIVEAYERFQFDREMKARFPKPIDWRPAAKREQRRDPSIIYSVKP